MYVIDDILDRHTFSAVLVANILYTSIISSIVVMKHSYNNDSVMTAV